MDHLQLGLISLDEDQFAAVSGLSDNQMERRTGMPAKRKMSDEEQAALENVIVKWLEVTGTRQL